MKRFHFRPAAVLELRRLEHDVARAQLVCAQQEREHAERAVVAAEAATADAEADYRTCLTAGDEADALARHRNWIASRRAGAEGCRRGYAERQLAQERAAANVRRTHRQVRVLERLRDRAWRTYQHECRRLDAIEMDQLAMTQYTRRKAGGIDDDH
jgi:flagellar biosynthesis chaperone FliJ